MNFTRFWKTAASLVSAPLLLFLAPPSVLAQPAPVSVAQIDKLAEQFGKHAQFSRPRLSPDRSWIAVLVSANGRRQVAVMPTKGAELTRITDLTKQTVSDFRWINNQRLWISIDLEGNESYGAYAVNKDGTQFRVLQEPPILQAVAGAYVPKYVGYVGPVPNNDRLVVVESNERSGRTSDVYHMDIYTGRKTLQTLDRPAEVRSWGFDEKLIPRFADSWEKDTRQFVGRYRASADAPWVEIYRRSPGREIFGVVRFLANGKLIVLTNKDRDNTVVSEFDPVTKTFGAVIAAAADGYDMGFEDIGGVPNYGNPSGGLIFDPEETEKILGFDYQGAKSVRTWIDERYAAMQKAIDAALPDRSNRFAPFKKGVRPLVTSRSDRHPASFFWFDPEKQTLETLAINSPWIQETEMARMEPIEYTARDGLRIRGYLTMPLGKEPKNLPLILHPHGGPWARDTWGYNPEIQFLAALGYAVLQMDFRISTGYGNKHFQAGWKTIGNEMQNDKMDGLKWVVDKGIVDPKRVCVYGGSYGGYAALRAITRDADAFRCGVNTVGVSDWDIIMRGLWRSGRETQGPDEISEWIGSLDNSDDRRRFEKISVLSSAAIQNVKVPLLSAYGFNDPRVPIEHLKVLERAMNSGGKAHDTIVYPNEGHGWARQENTIDWYKRLGKFVVKHNPPN